MGFDQLSPSPTETDRQHIKAIYYVISEHVVLVQGILYVFSILFGVGECKPRSFRKRTDPQGGHAGQFCPLLRREALDEHQDLLHFLLEHHLQIFVTTRQLHEDLRAVGGREQNKRT